jgi:hypothetical protein
MNLFQQTLDYLFTLGKAVSHGINGSQLKCIIGL